MNQLASLKDHCWSRTPNYRPGAKLTAEQLNEALADAVRRDRLVNVAMHGVGVAFGFAIKSNEDGRMIVRDGCIHLSCGLAFDKYGRMLFWPGGPLSVADIVGHKPDCEGRYTLSVHYAEKTEADDDPCHDDTAWVDRCVAFTLCRGCDCHDACAPDVPEDDCMTRQEWICTRNGFEPGDVPMDAALDFACKPPAPLKSSHCGRVSYDPEAGMPLSCVEICDVEKERVDCRPRFEFCHCGEHESCCTRPVVYRNRLLHELINLDDVPLAKVAAYSWSDWEMREWSDEDRVPFSEFRDRVKACQGWRHSPWDGFAVMFSRPVRRRTLHPMSVLMDIYILETRANYWEPWRIPIQVRPLGKDGELLGENCDDDCVWGVVICPEDDWIKYEVDDRKSTILDCANKDRLARVEITLRGQFIRDCCGLMIDARPPDIDRGDPCDNRAGQGRPGDDFTSIFRIGRDRSRDDRDARPEQEAKDDNDKTEPASKDVGKGYENDRERAY